MPALTTAQTAELVLLSREIHGHPELAYQERRAVAVALGEADGDLVAGLDARDQVHCTRDATMAGVLPGAHMPYHWLVSKPGLTLERL